MRLLLLSYSVWNPIVHEFSLVRCHETALVVVIGFAEADHAIFVINSVRSRTHAVVQSNV